MFMLTYLTFEFNIGHDMLVTPTLKLIMLPITLLYSWNRSPRVIRGQPIINMFKEIRRKIRRSFATRKADAIEINASAPPFTYEKLNKKISETDRMKKKIILDNLFEVFKGQRSFIVDMNKGTHDYGT